MNNWGDFPEKVKQLLNNFSEKMGKGTTENFLKNYIKREIISQNVI